MIFLGSFIRLHLFILATISFCLLFLDLFRIHIIHCHDFTLVFFFRLVNTALQFFSLGTLDI